jgi:ubiquinone/menaquinone biosynthesis C-methylase UbiE
MNTRPWIGFDDVDRSEDPEYILRYLDLLRTRNDTHAYKERSFDLLNLQEGDRVLDVGCGAGQDCVALAARVGTHGRAVGIDPSVTLVTEARRRTASRELPVEFHVGEAYSLPFETASFHACRADRVFLYLERPADALAEVVRVLRPGGVLYVRDPDMETFLLDGMDPRRTRAVGNFFSDSFRNGWSGRRLPRMFRAAGFRDVHYDPSTLVLRTYEDADTLFALGRTVRGAVGAGVLTADEGQDFLEDLQAKDRAGKFFFSLTFFETYGEK